MSKPGSPTYGQRTSLQRKVMALGFGIFLLFGGISIAGFATNPPNPPIGQAVSPSYGQGWATLLVFGLIGFVIGVWAFITPAVERAVSTIKVAVQPVPPPQYVQRELTSYFGRPATAAEVDLVLRYLRDRKLAAQMDTALLGGALVVAHHFGTQH